MKKLTAGIFATLLAVVSADGAYAAIASKGYVDDKVGEVSQTVTTLSGTVSGHTTQIAAKADSSTVTALAGRVDTAEGEIDKLQTEVDGKQAALGFTPENSANKTTTLSGTSTDTQYPSAKAVWDTIQTETTGIASDADVTALEGRVGTLETASKTHATKTELAGKQDKLSQTGSASQPVYVNAEGKVTAGNTIPTVTTSITTGQAGAAQAGAVADILATKANAADLGDLAKLDVVGSAQITDGAVANVDIASKAVTKEKLADDIVTSLGKADSALQKTTADAAYAVKALEGQVGTVSAANMGTTATTVVTAIKEVAGEAAAAASAASAADTKAVAAQGAADTAQGAAEAAQADVDALGTTVSEQGTRLTAAETTASAALPKTTYNTQVGVVSATNMGTTASTVVAAIKEVADEAAAAQGTANSANTAAGAAQDAAEAAQATADAAIPAPDGECSNPTNKCVLTFNNSAYAWEVIERGEGGE